MCLLLCIVTAVLTVTPAAALSSSFSPVTASVALPSLSSTQKVQQPTASQKVSKVRILPNSGSVIIGCLENNTKLTVLGEEGDFYRIDCYDMQGYIAKWQVRNENGTYYVNCLEDSGETTALTSYGAAAALELSGTLRTLALQYLGVPYVIGGVSPRGFDCSGFTQYIFGSQGISLKRTVAQQLQSGVIVAKENLQCGDLVFFKNTTASQSLFSHVGIYIGNNQIVHASDSQGITISDLSLPYYTEHYLCARRVVLTGVAAAAIIPSIGVSANVNSSYWRENSRTAP